MNYGEDNKAIYGFKTALPRYTLAGYFLFVILSSLIGDTTILVGSIKYKAIKLHRVIVTIILHIAVCDLLVVVTQALPRFVTLIADEWVLGDLGCRAFTYFSYYLNPVGILLLCGMTAGKLLLLKFPLRFGSTSSKKAHIFCGACWVIALAAPVSMAPKHMGSVFFTYYSYGCSYHFWSSNTWSSYLLPLLYILLVILPMCLVVTTSICLLIIAKKVASRRREDLKWQGITTTVLTAAVNCISWLPQIVTQFLAMQVETSITSWRVAVSFLHLNTICNFYIYCLSVTSFRNFVRSRLKMVLKKQNFSASRGIFTVKSPPR